MTSVEQVRQTVYNVSLSEKQKYRSQLPKMSQPKTLPPTFTLLPLKNHFTKTPNPAGANALIDLPGDTFLVTEEEITVIAAALYVICVKYDKMTEEERPGDVESVRKWIVGNRGEVVGKLAGKVEPPFPAMAIDQMLKDVGAMMEELLVKTLPPASTTTTTTTATPTKSDRPRPCSCPMVGYDSI